MEKWRREKGEKKNKERKETETKEVMGDKESSPIQFREKSE